MKAFLDTSVFVATFYADHENHERSFELFLRHKKSEVCCASHTLAEVFATVTGMPGKYRTSGDEAMLFLENIQERVTTVALDEEEYFQAIQDAASRGIAGGGIYDAVLGACAMKANAKAIYTWNVKHFIRLAPAIAERVSTP